MPAKSAAQQKAAGAALSMSEKQLEAFAHTTRRGKPEQVAK